MISREDFIFKSSMENKNLYENNDKEDLELNGKTIFPKMMCHHCKILLPFYNMIICENKIPFKNKSTSKKKYLKIRGYIKKVDFGAKR